MKKIIISIIISLFLIGNTYSYSLENGIKELKEKLKNTNYSLIHNDVNKRNNTYYMIHNGKKKGFIYLEDDGIIFDNGKLIFKFTLNVPIDFSLNALLIELKKEKFNIILDTTTINDYNDYNNNIIIKELLEKINKKLSKKSLKTKLYIYKKLNFKCVKLKNKYKNGENNKLINNLYEKIHEEYIKIFKEYVSHKKINNK